MSANLENGSQIEADNVNAAAAQGTKSSDAGRMGTGNISEVASINGGDTARTDRMAKVRARVQASDASYTDPQTFNDLSKDMQSAIATLWSIMYSYGGLESHVTQADDALNTFINTGLGMPKTVGELNKVLTDIDNE